jgi:hypothetical protein
MNPRVKQKEGERSMTTFNDTVEAPVFQTTGGTTILTGDNGGLVQLLHPSGGHPHIELIANETTLANTGAGLVNVADGDGNTAIQLNGHGGTIIAPVFQTSGGKTILSGDNGGLVQLLHPSGGHPHIELIANETILANTGAGLVNVADGDGNTTIQLNGHGGTIIAPVFQTTGGKAILSGDNGGLVQLLHPSGGHPHIELIANETTLANSGGGLVNVTDGGGNTTIQLDGHAGTIKAKGTIEASDITLTQAGITFRDGTTQATAAQRGPAGPQGPAGPRGPAGPPGSLPSQVVVGTSLGGGQIRLLGPVGSATVGLGSNTINANSGVVAVFDATGNTAKASLSVLGGSGVVTADIKNFRVPHPTQPDMDIVYACIEGPEAAVYARGTAHMVNGKGTVSLPDHFVSVVGAASMTVQVTPLSTSSLGLAVVTKGLSGIAVNELHGGVGNYDFDWEVKCVRKDHEDYQVTRLRNEMGFPEPSR